MIFSFPYETVIPVEICLNGEALHGDLQLASKAQGTVIFIHGSGSSRFSPRNREVATTLRHAGYNTLLIDLLTEQEERIDSYTSQFRFDISLLALRSILVTRWVLENPALRDLPVGLFGASTGAAAALIAAAEMPNIGAVVSRGGRPDLAGASLSEVQVPTLLIVGGEDHPVLELNQEALIRLHCVKKLHVIPLATHLFEESGALGRVADAAVEWFSRYLTASASCRAAAGQRRSA